MKTTSDGFARVLRAVLPLTGIGAALTGVARWAGYGDKLGPTHMLLGVGLVVAAGIAAARAARAGAPRAVVTAPLALGIVLVAFGVAHRGLLPGPWHWTLQALHVLTGIAAMIAAGRAAAARAPDRPPCAGARLPVRDAAAEFLAKERIAVTGVSRTPREHGGNVVYRRLRERGVRVFAVNPSAPSVEGDPAFPSLASIPGGVDAVVIATRPEHAMATLRECAELGVTLVWMHRAFGPGSVSEDAVAWGRARGIRVIDGGCPLMFVPHADAGHSLMRRVLTLTGSVPRRVS